MRNVAILIFDGVQIIDYTGPYEVFGQMNRYLHNEVATVAERPEPITTSMGMTVTPKYTLETCPPPDIVVVPGGDVRQTTESEPVLAWLRAQAERAEVVMSVCNGAFILAQAGLLDVLEATTYWGMLSSPAEFAPATRVVCDRRFVDNGKVITTAGLSSGIDGALHVMERLYGRGWAQAIANNMEYNWQPESGYARGDFADRKYLMPVYSLVFGMEGDVLATEGNRDRWHFAWQARRAAPADLSTQLASVLTAQAHWSPGESFAQNGTADRSWTFTGENGEHWQGRTHVESGEVDGGMVDIAIERAS